MTKRKPEAHDTFTYTVQGRVKHTKIKRASELLPGDRTDFGKVKTVHNRRIFTYVQFYRDDNRLVMKTLPPDYRVPFTASDEPVHFTLGDGSTMTISKVPGDGVGVSAGPLPANEDSPTTKAVKEHAQKMRVDRSDREALEEAFGRWEDEGGH